MSKNEKLLEQFNSGVYQLKRVKKLLTKYPGEFPVSQVYAEDQCKLVTSLERFCSSMEEMNNGLNQQIIELWLTNNTIHIISPPLLERRSSDSWYLHQSIKKKMEKMRVKGLLANYSNNNALWIIFCRCYTNYECSIPDSRCLELRRIVNAVSESLLFSDRATKISFIFMSRRGKNDWLHISILSDKDFRNSGFNLKLHFGNRYRKIEKSTTENDEKKPKFYTDSA